ncbi:MULTISPECIES: ABC transporter ATP-binding protein [Deferrisoma]
MPHLLEVENLRVSFHTRAGEVPAVRGLDLTVGHGEAVGLVGESGCGKSVTALSLMGLVPDPGRIEAGSIRLEGRELVGLPDEEYRRIRGRQIGMVFQEPMTSLNPVFTVGFQVAEALTTHFDLPRDEVRRRCVELLTEVGIPAPEDRLRAYPAQLSGGLRQRVMIAIAVACRPQLVIADEPTTALDVTIQAQIMGLLGRLRRERGMALLLITHDLGLVAQNVDRVVVMYAGYAVEEASTRELFRDPLHPYTRGLLGSIPGASGIRRGERLRAIPGNVPHPSRVPSGCPFRDRCDLAIEACGDAVPALEEKRPGHRARCIRVDRDV